jgi:hypothetical protein
LNIIGVLVACEFQVFCVKAPIDVMIQDNKIASLPYPRCVPVWVPSISNVDGKFVSVIGREGGSDCTNRIFIPSLKGVVVGRLIEKLEAHDIGDRK